jgi:hypothetical protein
MFNRLVGWRQIWMALAILWTIAAMTSGWMNLPRAQHMPHDPQFASKLSDEASSILLGTDFPAKLATGALIWSEAPRIVRMPNGMQLAFPATTTDERAAFVASEYRQLLGVQADKQRGQYLLAILVLWLAPLLLAGLSVSLICRAYKPPPGSAIPRQPPAIYHSFAIPPKFRPAPFVNQP